MKILIIILTFALSACGPVKVPITNQYKLEQFSYKKVTNQRSKKTLLVSQPEGMAGTQTEQMQYVVKPFELSSFAHNSWISTPANMLYPLITQSLQQTNYFYAIASGPYIDKADYRLDTQVISLQQNFLSRPSTIELIVKVSLSHIADNRVVASRVFYEKVPCPYDTPYGGVIAANRATKLFTKALTRFVIAKVKGDAIQAS